MLAMARAMAALDATIEAPRPVRGGLQTHNPPLAQSLRAYTMTFLAIDIGNTRLKWALYEAPAACARVLAQGAEFLDNVGTLAEGPWAALDEPASMLGCTVAGEAVRRLVEEQLELWDFAPQWVVARQAEAGLSNGYDHPTRLGADRWVAMIGAWHRMLAQGPRRPLVVALVGTAVTVEAIDASGRFLGGLILPGHGIMLRALESGTAGLHVPTGEVRHFPTNTSDALTSGGTYAIAGAMERMVQNVRVHCGAEPLCLMTGGAGWKMAPSLSTPFEQVDNLIFDGLLQMAQARTRERLG